MSAGAAGGPFSADVSFVLDHGGDGEDNPGAHVAGRCGQQAQARLAFAGEEGLQAGGCPDHVEKVAGDRLQPP